MSPQPNETALRRTLDRQGLVRGGITTTLTRSLLSLWDGADKYDHDLVTALAARSSTLVSLAQRQQSRATTAYLSNLTRQHGITPQEPAAAVEYPRQASQLDVYQRPAEQYRYRMSLSSADLAGTAAQVGGPAGGVVRTLQQLADQASTARLRQLAEYDMALTVRDASAAFAGANRRTVTGTRRVLHPELAVDGGKSCGLCVVAADRIYSVDELMALHDGCHCAVVLIYRGADPGKGLNDADLKRIYDAAGGTGRDDLQQTRVTVQDNGEVGAVLARDGDGFRDAADVARARGLNSPAPFDRQASYLKQIEVLETTSASLRRRAAAGEDLALPISWQTIRLTELRRLVSAAPAIA